MRSEDEFSDHGRFPFLQICDYFIRVHFNDKNRDSLCYIPDVNMYTEF